MNAEQIIAEYLFHQTTGEAHEDSGYHARGVARALREAGIDLDHTYEVQAWWYGTIGTDGNLTGVTEGSEGDPELWEPWARERFTIPLFIRRPLGEDQ